MLGSESTATIPPFGPIEYISSFSRFPANESFRRTGFHFSLSANPVFTFLHLRSPVHVVPPLKITDAYYSLFYCLLVSGGLLWRSGGAGSSVRGTELGAAPRRVGGEGGPGQDQGAHPSPLLARHQALQGAAGCPQELPPAGLPLGRV